MSVRKRAGSPFYWFDFTINGVRFRGSTGEKTLSLAKLKEADEIQRAKKLGARTEHWTLRMVFGAYWQDIGKFRAGEKTIFRQLEHMSDILGRDTELRELTAHKLIDYRARRRGTAPKGRKVREHSVNRDFAMLRAAINYAHRAYGQPVPAIDWKSFRAAEPDHRKRFLSRDEYQALMNAANPSIRPIILCAVATGLRRGNIVSLTWNQVMMAERLIRVKLKGGRNHAVRIAPPLMAALALTPPEQRRGKVFDLTNLRKRWEAAIKAADLSDVRFHDLRHTFASWGRQAGADIASLKEALGHSSINMTMRYAHVRPDEEITAFDRVSDTLGTIGVTSAQKTAEK